MMQGSNSLLDSFKSGISTGFNVNFHPKLPSTDPSTFSCSTNNELGSSTATNDALTVSSFGSSAFNQPISAAPHAQYLNYVRSAPPYTNPGMLENLTSQPSHPTAPFHQQALQPIPQSPIYQQRASLPPTDQSLNDPSQFQHLRSSAPIASGALNTFPSTDNETTDPSLLRSNGLAPPVNVFAPNMISLPSQTLMQIHQFSQANGLNQQQLNILIQNQMQRQYALAQRQQRFQQLQPMLPFNNQVRSDTVGLQLTEKNPSTQFSPAPRQPNTMIQSSRNSATPAPEPNTIANPDNYNTLPTSKHPNATRKSHTPAPETNVTSDFHSTAPLSQEQNNDPNNICQSNIALNATATHQHLTRLYYQIAQALSRPNLNPQQQQQLLLQRRSVLLQQQQLAAQIAAANQPQPSNSADQSNMQVIPDQSKSPPSNMHALAVNPSLNPNGIASPKLASSAAREQQASQFSTPQSSHSHKSADHASNITGALPESTLQLSPEASKRAASLSAASSIAMQNLDSASRIASKQSTPALQPSTAPSAVKNEPTHASSTEDHANDARSQGASSIPLPPTYQYDRLPQQYKTIVTQDELKRYVARERRWEKLSIGPKARVVKMIEDIRSDMQQYAAKEEDWSLRYRSRFGPLPIPHQRLPRPTTLGMRVILPQDHKQLRRATGVQFGAYYQMLDYDFTSTQHLAQSTKENELIAIRLDIDVEGLKIRDCFTWNLHDNVTTPEHFAEIMTEDLRLANSLNQDGNPIPFQLRQFPYAGNIQPSGIGVGPSAIAIRTAIAKSIQAQLDDYRSWNAVVPKVIHMEDLRFVVKLHITVKNSALVDQFEWDLLSSRNSPEVFATNYCHELGLDGEYRSSIAHCIREQVQLHMKALALAGYPFDGSPIAHISLELADAFLIPIEQASRAPSMQEYFTPAFVEMTEEEAERLEKDSDRDTRRKRRTTRKMTRTGGAAFSTLDQEPPKTKRSHFPPPIQSTRICTRRLQIGPTIKTIVPSAPQAPGWSCVNCGCPYLSTPVIRRGPLGDRSLCNACGLYYLCYGQVRPVPSTTRQAIPPRSQIHQYQAPVNLDSSTIMSGDKSSVVVPLSDEEVPLWLLQRRTELMRDPRFADDRFHFVRKAGNIKIQCADCCGNASKVYASGPGTTLTNFEVHLKNRMHRRNVAERMYRERQPYDASAYATPKDAQEYDIPSQVGSPKRMPDGEMRSSVVKKPRTQVIEDGESATDDYVGKDPTTEIDRIARASSMTSDASDGTTWNDSEDPANQYAAGNMSWMNGPMSSSSPGDAAGDSSALSVFGDSHAEDAELDAYIRKEPGNSDDEESEDDEDEDRHSAMASPHTGSVDSPDLTTRMPHGYYAEDQLGLNGPYMDDQSKLMLYNTLNRRRMSSSESSGSTGGY